MLEIITTAMPPFSWRLFFVISAVCITGWNLYGYVSSPGWFAHSSVTMMLVPPLLLSTTLVVSNVIGDTRKRIRNGEPAARVGKEAHPHYSLLAIMYVGMFALLVWDTREAILALYSLLY